MSEIHTPSLIAATYNIHYSIGTDRRFAPDRIADVILSLSADVIALQEVGWHFRGQAGVDQFELLARLTGFRVIQGLTRNHPNAHFGNAILTRFDVVRSDTIDLSVPLRAPRCALIAELEAGHARVRVANVHFGLDPWERREQVARLTRVLDQAPTMPTLLLGDFNEWRAAPAYLKPIEAMLPRFVMPESYHSRRPMLRFDRIYASGHLDLQHARTVQDRAARRASDHLPVVTSVKWRDSVAV